MIHSNPTKNGTGVTIWGDTEDLMSLHDTVHWIDKSMNEHSEVFKGESQLLMNFAYEIRKAYSGSRLSKTISDNSYKNSYYGFNCVWTDILLFTSILRHNAGFIQTNKKIQSNLYILEYVIEKALLAYDSEGAYEIIKLYESGINVRGKYSFLIYQELHLKFITSKVGKVRFREIPPLMKKYCSPHGLEHQKLIKEADKSAIEMNCEVSDLEMIEFPEIKW